MNWLSIDTNISENPKVQFLINEEGPEAYGVWNLTMTKVAQEVDIDNEKNGYVVPPGDRSPCEFLSLSLGTTPDRLEEIFDKCAEFDLIDKDEWESGNIYLPNLLERDQVKNYLDKQKAGRKGGKQGQTTKQSGSKREATGKQAESTRQAGKKEKNHSKKKKVDKDKDVDEDKEHEIKDFSFQDGQREIVETIPDDLIDPNRCYGLAGKWINNYGIEQTVQSIRDMDSKDKWETIRDSGKPAIGFIVETIKNYQEPEPDDQTDWEKKAEKHEGFTAQDLKTLAEKG